jgi:hypothetical protein
VSHRKIQIAARLDSRTLDVLDTLALKEGRSRSDIISTAVLSMSDRRDMSIGGLDRFDRWVTNPDIPHAYAMAAIGVRDTLLAAHFAAESVFGSGTPVDSVVKICQMMMKEHTRLEGLAAEHEADKVVEDDDCDDNDPTIPHC